MTEHLKAKSFGRRVSIRAGVVASSIQRRELRRFQCPRCHRTLQTHEPTHGQPDVPIRFFCRSCDVLWDTGLRTPRRIETSDV
jgi:RNase P subunit RPR2